MLLACRFCSCVCHSSISASTTTSKQEGHRTKNEETRNIRKLPGRINFRLPSKFQVFRVRSVNLYMSQKKILWPLGRKKSPVHTATALILHLATFFRILLPLHDVFDSSFRKWCLLFRELILAFFNLMHDTRLILTAPQIR